MRALLKLPLFGVICLTALISLLGYRATYSVPQTQARDLSVSGEDSLVGQWSGVISWPTVPIHMHLLPTGKVMTWDRHNHAETPAWDVTPQLWDPTNPTVFTALPLPSWDIFCSGHAFLADGRLLVAGGHIADAVGALTAGVYDPFTNSWTAVPDMNAGRWYPTTSTLANGDMLVLAGTKAGFGDINKLPQVWRPSTGHWRTLTGASMGSVPAWPDYYPFAYLAPNGKVFVAGPQQTARYLDTAGFGGWTDVASSSLSYRDYGSSAMYDDGKVLIVGGNPRDPNFSAPNILPSATAEVIDLNAGAPAFRTVAPMSIGRRHLNSTILPDGTVLVTGGTSKPGHDDPTGQVLYPELWDPNTETWSPMAPHTRYRGYHSNALLLPDARVLVAGGGHPNPEGGSAESNAEIYSPPYLFRGARPSITAAPAVTTYGETFSVETPDAANITSVNWIRLSSVTHGFNENQRINRLNFSRGANSLNVTAPAGPNLCPPGHYMLFILNGDGVPSVARIVRVVDSYIQLSTAALSVDESAGVATLAVNRGGPNTSESMMVNLATADSSGANGCSVLNTGVASARCDYVPATLTLYFAAGEISKTITVPIIDDSYAEDSESFTVTLSVPPGTQASHLASPSSATVTINDNETVNGPNPIDQTDFFVRQHYLDFLNREPDPGGFAFWTNEIKSCGSDAQCIEVKRINVSAAFFLSIEFQESSGFAYRLYKAALGRPPTYAEFISDRGKILKSADFTPITGPLANDFVSRPEFTSKYQTSSNGSYEFIDLLLGNIKQHSGADLAYLRNDLIQSWDNCARGGPPIFCRSYILEWVVDEPVVRQAVFSESFVLMEYFGYLRRNPSDPPDINNDGYNFWLNKLNQFNGNFFNAEMVKAFISSIEYRKRFGP